MVAINPFAYDFCSHHTAVELLRFSETKMKASIDGIPNERFLMLSYHYSSLSTLSSLFHPSLFHSFLFIRCFRPDISSILLGPARVCLSQQFLLFRRTHLLCGIVLGAESVFVGHPPQSPRAAFPKPYIPILLYVSFSNLVTFHFFRVKVNYPCLNILSYCLRTLHLFCSNSEPTLIPPPIPNQFQM